jgi:hypothetical protein
MTLKTVPLLFLATALAAVSLFFHQLITPRTPTSFLLELATGYTPILLGFLSMWLCSRARAKARRKGLILTYAIVLAPFAFSYPAWLFFIWVQYASGRYHLPMP